MKDNNARELLRVFVVLLIFPALTISFASSTTVEYNKVGNNVYGPGDPDNGVVVSEFILSDGGDTIFRGNPGAGGELHGFESNSTMFLNQTDTSVNGLNGFDNGEDIVNVSVVHSEGTKQNISGRPIGNFSDDLAFTDGGNKSDGIFNGDRTAGGGSEALVVSNTSNSSFLNRSSFVVAEGRMNLSNFSENIRFADANGNGFFNGSEALIRNQTNTVEYLNSSDNVVLDGEAGLEGFSSGDGAVRYADYNHDNAYDSGSAVIRYNDDDNILQSNDEVVVNGSADLEKLKTEFVSYYNNTPGGFTGVSEPIYWEGDALSHYELVNVSDVRIGDVLLEVEGAEKVKNGSLWNSSLALGKNLYDVENEFTQYDNGGNGTFRVLEYDAGGTSDSKFNITDSDQEVLIYDPSNDTGPVSGNTETSDIYVYDSSPGNTNIPNTISVGERFNDTQADNVPTPDKSYEPKVNVTFDGSDRFYNASKDNATLNISNGGEGDVIVVSPNSYGLNGFEGSLHPGGQMRFWNASKGNQDRMNGFFLDIDDNSSVTEGDIRLGGWERKMTAGEVSSEDADVGLNLTDLNNDDTWFTNQSGTAYTPGDGTKRGGREAIIISFDDVLDSEDVIIREGAFNEADFQDKTRYTDFDSDGSFEAGSAIVENTGSEAGILEDSDTIMKSGNASLENVSEELKYVENGSKDKFKASSSGAIIWDSGMDSNISKGFLNAFPDVVKVSGSANLQNLPQPPNAENQSGLVYVDSNRTGKYSQGEEILNITLLTNGSASSNINGTEIFNFANSTKHNNSSFYQDGDAIVNDTDMNSAFKDVLNGLEIQNIFAEDESYYRNVSPSQLNGDLKLYRDSSGDDELGSSDSFVADLTFGSADENNPPYIWNATDLNQKISDERRYFVLFESKNSLSNDAVFGFKANISDVEMNSTDEFTYYENPFKQIVDAYPPRIVGSSTGVYYSGNNSKELRNKVHVKIRDALGLDETFDYKDFELMLPRFEVIRAETSGKDKYNATNGDVILTLNESLGTNLTPEVRLANPGSDKEPGIIEDDAGNNRYNDSATSIDGLRPLISDIRYLDESVEGNIDTLELVFSERVNYTGFDASGWQLESNGIPCIQALAPGKEASFCSIENRKINVTSENGSSVFRRDLNLSSMDYVNSSNSNSSEYEIGRDLYGVTGSNTGYGGDGGFVVHEYNYSGSGNDSIWNPNNTGDQDVLVYSVNGTDLARGDVLIYDERPGNNNITIEQGEEFTAQDIKSSKAPRTSYRVSSDIGYIGSGSYDPENHNVSVNISYNSPSYTKPNSTFVRLASSGMSPSLGRSGVFNASGNVKFWNTSKSDVEPITDGLFVDVNSTGNISDGDVRLGEWTLPNEKQLYEHKIESEVDSKTAGSSLNNTLLNLSNPKYDSLGTKNIKQAEIANNTRQLDVSGNITSVNVTDSGKKLNISFNTTKYNINLSNTDQIYISYYSQSDVTSNDVDSIELNTNATGGIYDGLGTLNQDNTSVVEINATALEGVTGTSRDEPVVNFTVLDNLVTDQSGNTLANATGIEVEDDAAPAVTEASVKDADNDAKIDRVNLDFSENLDDPASNYGSAFNLSNGSIDDVWIRNPNSSNLTLNVSSVGGTAFTPNITIENNTIRDETGNAPKVEQNFTDVKDRANPILMNAEIDPYNSTSNYTFVDMQFSEKSAGAIDQNESVNISGSRSEFNRTDYNRNISVNYTEQLQTGDSPNITVIENMKDDSGNKLELYNQEKVVVNTFRREMTEGWNFVSFPIATTSTPNITEVTNISKLDVVWTREDSSWITYDPEAPENDFNEVRGGKGYYIKSEENFTLSPNVENKVESSVTGSDLLKLGTNLSKGWNLIGNIQEYNQEPRNNTAFASLNSAVDPVLGQKYDNGSKLLETSPPLKSDSPVNINGTMEVGEAYWAESSDGNITYRVPISDIP